ncbi:MAG: hypothetical protein OXC92_09280 [Flavobacteriaceae bacterium]|nr:hypothetical protein [Flavobacteriaceae bacterium]MCY4217159.1 hypothetical protein [Flavobacteriaceae bacterium]MCY4254387.1 hypothetical protein [Flavobacteriaceae bacterium]
MNPKVFFLLAIFLIGCQERKNSSENNSDSQIIDSITSPNDLIDFEISKLSDQIYDEAQLDDQWDDLIDVEESILDLLGLDRKAVDSYLVEIEEDLIDLEEGTFPEIFDTQAIRSRLALVRAFNQKSIFYIKSGDSDSTAVALEQFFIAYNAFIDRIESTHLEVTRTAKDSLLFHELDADSLGSLNPTLIPDTLP